MKFGDYYQVREWLERFIPLVYGKEELGLTRIEYLLKLLGNPQDKFKSIHITGTSGKGSTAFYAARLLQSSQKIKVGLHVSPHLVDIRERMQILLPPPSFSRKRESGFPIPSITLRASESGMTAEGSSLMPMEKFVELFDEIRAVVEKIKNEKPELTPSYFEILVAASFLYFAQERVDWAVVEVGLGGGLDATNVLKPEVCVITNVGLDHTEILGKTIEKIAAEKAGIIKKGTPVVTGYPSTLLRPVRYTQGKQAQDRSGSQSPRSHSGSSSGRALRVIADVARKRQAPLITIDTQDGQLANKLLAIEAVNLALSLRGARSFASAQDKLRNLMVGKDRFASLAMTNTGLPGRLEEIEPGVVLDGAHNPDKMRFLINILRARSTDSISSLQASSGREVSASSLRHPEPIRPEGSRPRRLDSGSKVSSHYIRTISKASLRVSEVVLVLGFKKGKDWKKMVDLLIKNLPVKKIIVTKFNAVTDTGRFAAVEPEEIRDYVAKVYRLPSTVCSNSQEAVFEAINSSVIAIRRQPEKQSKLKIATSFDELRTRNDNRLVLVTGSLYLVGEVRTMWQLPEF